MHYRTHTENNAKEKLLLLYVTKGFSQKHELVKHQATHNKDYPFKCSVCPEGIYFITK